MTAHWSVGAHPMILAVLNLSLTPHYQLHDWLLISMREE